MRCLGGFRCVCVLAMSFIVTVLDVPVSTLIVSVLGPFRF